MPPRYIHIYNTKSIITCIIIYKYILLKYIFNFFARRKLWQSGVFSFYFSSSDMRSNNYLYIIPLTQINFY